MSLIPTVGIPILATLRKGFLHPSSDTVDTFISDEHISLAWLLPKTS